MVANRVCWLDVLVVAAAGPIVPLVDESVLLRPVGRMAIRFGAIFFRPAVTRDLSETVHQVTGTLRRGHRVLVFPDCGAGAGMPRSVVARQQFASSAFQAAVDAAVVVSPVALNYGTPPGITTDLDGLDLSTLVGSIWRLVRSGPLTVRLSWLPVIPAVAGPGHRVGHRAAAAGRTEWAINRALSGGALATTAARSAVIPEQVPALALAS